MVPKPGRTRDLSGVSQTLAQIRQEYWVPHGRALTKLILKSCLTCKRAEGRPFVMPEMPPLPRERVARSVPFEFTGVDYFGPLYVKQFVQMSEQDIEIVSKKVLVSSQSDKGSNGSLLWSWPPGWGDSMRGW